MATAWKRCVRHAAPIRWRIETEEGSEGRRSLSEREDSVGIAEAQFLDGQHRKILCDGVPKERAKNANVVAATIARPEHGLVRELISSSETWGQVIAVFDVTIQLY